MLRQNEVVARVRDILYKYYGGSIENEKASKEIVAQVFKMVLDGRPSGQ